MALVCGTSFAAFRSIDLALWSEDHREQYSVEWVWTPRHMHGPMPKGIMGMFRNPRPDVWMPEAANPPNPSSV